MRVKEILTEKDLSENESERSFSSVPGMELLPVEKEAGGFIGEGSSMLEQLVYQKENLEYKYINLQKELNITISQLAVGINSEEKFTALSHYYISNDYSEIIKSNLAGEDTIVWKK